MSRFVGIGTMPWRVWYKDARGRGWKPPFQGLHRSLSVVGFGGVVDEVHEVVELRGDDDLGAAVALLADFRVVVCNRVELASAGG